MPEHALSIGELDGGSMTTKGKPTGTSGAEDGYRAPLAIRISTLR